MVLIGQLHLWDSLVFVFSLFCHTHTGLYQFSGRNTTLPMAFTQPWQCQNCTPARSDLPSEKGQGWDKEDEEGRVAAQPTRPLCPSTDLASHSSPYIPLLPLALHLAARRKIISRERNGVKEERMVKTNFPWASHTLPRLFSFLSVHEVRVPSLLRIFLRQKVD